MTNAIWTKQQALAAALTTAGLPTEPALPEKAVAPFRYVAVESLTPTATFGSFEVAFEVVCVARPGQNAVLVEQVTDMAVAVINAIRGIDDFAIGSPAMGQLESLSLNGTPHPAAPVTVNARITRADMEV